MCAFLGVHFACCPSNIFRSITWKVKYSMVLIKASHQYLAYQILHGVSCESQYDEDDAYSDRELGLDLNQHLNDGFIIHDFPV